VVISGSGDRHFCTGTDIRDVAARGTTNAGTGLLSQSVFWTARQNRVWKPVVCAVNGLAAGGGLHFVVDADIVVASSTAAFMDTHVDVGMVGAIENIGLVQRLPLGSVLRMTLLGKRYRMEATRAHALGLVDEMVPPEQLLETAMSIARDICEASPSAVRGSLEAIWSSLGVPYEHALEHGWKIVKGQWTHPDFKEGPRAFAEGRKPRWTDPADPDA
jgi:enoyl-CoA hydratase/carnithine racemase